MGKKHLSLTYDESTFRLMEQRKKKFMKKMNYDELSWEDFIKIKVLCNKKW